MEGGVVSQNDPNNTTVHVSEFKYWRNVAGVATLTTVPATSLVGSNGFKFVWVNTELSTFSIGVGPMPDDSIPLAQIFFASSMVSAITDLRAPYGKPDTVKAASGDLGGDYPGPTVDNIQGVPVATIIPTTDEKDALSGAGVAGPSTSNKYVLEDNLVLNKNEGFYVDYGSLVATHSLPAPSGTTEVVTTIFSGEQSTTGNNPGTHPTGADVKVKLYYTTDLSAHPTTLASITNVLVNDSAPGGTETVTANQALNLAGNGTDEFSVDWDFDGDGISTGADVKLRIYVEEV
jgi:hypothetical protein